MNWMTIRRGWTLNLCRAGMSALTIALAAGCGGDEGAPPQESPDPPDTQEGTDVTVRIFDRYINGQETVDVVPDLSSLRVAALIPDGLGGFRTIEAEPPANGVFRIPAVPDGVYYLQRAVAGQKTFMVTAERDVQFISYYAGRSDVAMAETSPQLVLDATGLSPWGDSHFLELASYGAGVMGGIVTTADIPPGATTLQQADAEERTFLRPGLIDGSRGDQAWLVQHVDRTAGAFMYASIATAAELSPFTQVEGQSTALTAAFQDAPQRTLALDWRRSGFAAAAAQVHPSATPFSEDLMIDLAAGPQGQYLENFFPMLLSLAGDTSDTSDATIDLIYGNPFPAQWAEMLTICASYQVELTVPGAANPDREGARICSVAPLAGLAAVQIEPSVSPPADIRVNGQQATAQVDGIGTSPEVSWSPPTVGTPQQYRVQLRRYDTTEESFVTEAVILTEGTSVTIPPGVIQSGSVYTLSVQVSSDRGQAGALAGVLVP